MASSSSLSLTTWLVNTKVRYGALYKPVLKHASLSLHEILRNCTRKLNMQHPQSQSTVLGDATKAMWHQPRQQMALLHAEQSTKTHTYHAQRVTQAGQGIPCLETQVWGLNAQLWLATAVPPECAMTGTSSADVLNQQIAAGSQVTSSTHVKADFCRLVACAIPVTPMQAASAALLRYACAYNL